jgi:hypothetical protein
MDKSILHGYIDFLSDYDSVFPFPSYRSGVSKWIDDFERVLHESVPSEEIEGFCVSDDIQTIFTLLLSNVSTGGWGTIPVEERQTRIKALLETLQVGQRTTEWYAQSKTVLTASQFSNILGTPRGVSVLALQKATPDPENGRSDQACSTISMSAFDWGIRFEPVVKQILTTLWNCEIAEVGRFIHPVNTRLAASPDGIIMNAADPNRVGRLLEIKCPVRREINGKIPFDYWCQMQIQMEVTGIDECDYVEMKIASSYKDSKYEPPTEEPGTLYNGLVWLYQCFETCELKYAYTALEKKDLDLLGWHCLEEIPWHLDKMFTQTMVRDSKWYEGTAVKQDEFWLRVEDAKNGLIEPPKRRPRAPSVNGYQIMDDVT